MHPFEEAIEFLLKHVARTGDLPAQNKAEYILNRISEHRRDGEAAEPAKKEPAAEHVAAEPAAQAPGLKNK